MPLVNVTDDIVQGNLRSSIPTVLEPVQEEVNNESITEHGALSENIEDVQSENIVTDENVNNIILTENLGENVGNFPEHSPSVENIVTDNVVQITVDDLVVAANLVTNSVEVNMVSKDTTLVVDNLVTANADVAMAAPGHDAHVPDPPHKDSLLSYPPHSCPILQKDLELAEKLIKKEIVTSADDSTPVVSKSQQKKINRAAYRTRSHGAPSPTHQ